MTLPSGAKRLALFFAAFTLAFLLWVKTFFYTLPFLLGLLLALALGPVTAFLRKRWGLSPGGAALAAVAAAFALLTACLAGAGVLLARELASFLERASRDGYQEFAGPVAEFLRQAEGFLARLDLDFLRAHQEELAAALQGGLDLAVSCAKAALGLLTSVPAAVTLVLVTACAAFFFARDMDALAGWARRALPPQAARHISAARRGAGSSGRRYLLSCLFLYFLTFCETCVILGVLDLPYPVTIGLLAAVADVLPVLGPGFVLAPVAGYQLLVGDVPRALGVVLGWLVIAAVRQVTEPRLISSSAKVHPLASLAAVYFSLVGRNLWLLVYVLGLCSLYGILRETGALPPLSRVGLRKDGPG